MTNNLSSSKIKSSRVETIYTVEESRTPDEFAKIEADELELPPNCIVVMKPTAMPEKIRLTVERCMWSEAHPIGGEAGGVTIQDVDNRIIWFGGTQTVTDDTTDFYTAEMLDNIYPDKPARFKVVCEQIGQAYEKATATSWFSYAISMLS